MIRDSQFHSLDFLNSTQLDKEVNENLEVFPVVSKKFQESIKYVFEIPKHYRHKQRLQHLNPINLIKHFR